jgi:predicted NAD/FAD-binding protein
MNLLQSLDSAEPFCVSLNSSHRIDPARVLRRMRYEHPVYDHTSASARARKCEIQGQRNTWYAGAYWGFGFHEDGLRSANDVAHALGIHWPLYAVPVAALQTVASQSINHDAQRVSAS